MWCFPVQLGISIHPNWRNHIFQKGSNYPHMLVLIGITDISTMIIWYILKHMISKLFRGVVRFLSSNCRIGNPQNPHILQTFHGNNGWFWSAGTAQREQAPLKTWVELGWFVETCGKALDEKAPPGVMCGDFVLPFIHQTWRAGKRTINH